MYPHFFVNLIKSSVILYLFITFYSYGFLSSKKEVSSFLEGDCQDYRNLLYDHHYNVNILSRIYDYAVLDQNFKCLYNAHDIFIPESHMIFGVFSMHMSSGNYIQAYEELKKSFRQQPHLKEYHTFLAFLLFKRIAHDYSDYSTLHNYFALEVASHFIRKYPDSVYINYVKNNYIYFYENEAYNLYDKAVFFHNERDYVGAIFLYKDIIRKYPLSFYAKKARSDLQDLTDILFTEHIAQVVYSDL